MEVFLGALLTLGIVVTANLVLRKPVDQVVKKKLRYTQTHVYTLMAPILDYLPAEEVEQPKRQTTSFIKNSYVRVVIVENSAYWIKDNALFRADIEEGFVRKETTQRVDTMTMDKLELERTMTIVEKLREGLDEDSGTGE